MAAVNIAGLRRNLKNVAHNYTDAQVKVREATSNDPWGPSSTVMSEIADLTYNVVAFSEIMQMIWKRLNDHGKNWRHVYKALVLLEYLIKTGSEKVAQQCKENIFAIQTLKDFQYLDDNRDQGINVREKAKSLVALLKDDERLRNERVRALKAKERFAQSAAGIGSDTVYNHNRERMEHQQQQQQQPGQLPSQSPTAEFDPQNPEMEAARPQTAGEEELQLQLALAMSREEAEQEESKGKSDDMRLQLALQKSQQEDTVEKPSKPSNDLLDLDFGALHPQPPPLPQGQQQQQQQQQPPPPTRTSASLDPWGMPQAAPAAAANDPWGGGGGVAGVETAAGAAAAAVAVDNNNDPWSPVKQKPVQNNSSPLPPPPPPAPAGMMAAAAAAPRPASVSPSPAARATVNDPWTAVPTESSAPATASDPAPHFDEVNPSADPFSPQAQHHLKEFDLLRNQIEVSTDESERNNNGGTTSPNPFDLNDLQSGLPASVSSSDMATTLAEATGARPKNSVNKLLGEHSKLVNLDDLVATSTTTNQQARNPFEQQQQNPFQAKQQKPLLNELIQQNTWSSSSPTPSATQQQQQAPTDPEFNPFF